MTAWPGPVLLVSVLAVAGCHASSSHATSRAPLSTRPSARPSTTSATSATATSRPHTTAPPSPPGGWPTARQAADHLLAAWRAADRVGARRGTDPAAVASMFAIPVGPLVDRGCDTGEFTTSGCEYRVAGGGLQLNMDKRTAGWVVAEARFSP